MSPRFWLALGFFAQFLFFMRFLVQWIVSERRGQSTIPTLFWYFSLAGGLLLLIYAVWRRDPVFITGQACGLVIYIRNLMLIHSRRSSQGSGGPSEAD